MEKDAADAVLCEDVKSLAFTYIDHEGNELDTWNSDQDDVNHATPKEVRIQLEIGSDNANDRVKFETSVRLPVVRAESGN